ncbi:MAG: T9SS type A sorting domain-containing protein [Flavitalea sp.]
MKTTFKSVLKNSLLILGLAISSVVNAQTCTPMGDQVTYGTSDTWIGYVYSGMSFTTYRGYVTEGTSGNPAFDQSFGGANVTYNTNGCPITTQNFSVRYRLRKTYTNQNVQFTVGGDDGYRLSIDGGATWLINRWSDQSYVTTSATALMNGTYDIVLEYYENAGDNRITFAQTVICSGTEDQSVYGTGNVWRGYIYSGQNFNTYKGLRLEGSAGDPNFDENFGGDNVTISGLSCPQTTENFSTRFRLTRNMPAGTYVFTVGGDDGYRFSLDGGATWAINRWSTQSYVVTSHTVSLSGTYDMVIEYFENTGQNRISFTMSASLLPVKLTAFNTVLLSNNKAQISWKAQSETNFEKYIIQKSTNGSTFTDIATVAPKTGNQYENNYLITDAVNGSGTVYYRLAMKDLDGSITYSLVSTLLVSKITETKIYPTITNGNSIILESPVAIEKAKIDLYDMNGRLLESKATQVRYGKQELSLVATKRIKGSYLVRVSDKDALVINKIIMVQ